MGTEKTKKENAKEISFKNISETNRKAVQIKNYDENHIIIQKIKKLRTTGKSYQEIGFILNISKSEAYMLEKGKWFPRTESVMTRILDNIVRAKI